MIILDQSSLKKSKIDHSDKFEGIGSVHPSKQNAKASSEAILEIEEAFLKTIGNPFIFQVICLNQEEGKLYSNIDLDLPPGIPQSTNQLSCQLWPHSMNHDTIANVKAFMT